MTYVRKPLFWTPENMFALKLGKCIELKESLSNHLLAYKITLGPNMWQVVVRSETLQAEICF